jgi:hypothetical protein
VAGDLDDPSSLKTAFSNSAVVFGSTDFWQHLIDPASHALAASQGRTPNEVAYDREVAQGKTLVDAAAANVHTLERFVLSTCSDSSKWSNGEVKWCLHFDAKAEAVKYCRETYPELWKKTSLLQLAYFVTNWRSFSGTPKKQEDGSFVVSLPMSGDRKMPIVDPGSDTGESSIRGLRSCLGRSTDGARELHQSARRATRRTASRRMWLVHDVQGVVRDLQQGQQRDLPV